MRAARGAAAHPAPPFAAFLTGLYSRMHLLAGTDFELMVADAPVPDDVRAALLERTGELWELLRLAAAWEHGEWDHVGAAGAQLGLHHADMSSCYLDAVGFAEEAAGGAGRTPAGMAPVAR